MSDVPATGKGVFSMPVLELTTPYPILQEKISLDWAAVQNAEQVDQPEQHKHKTPRHSLSTKLCNSDLWKLWLSTSSSSMANA